MSRWAERRLNLTQWDGPRSPVPGPRVPCIPSIRRSGQAHDISARRRSWLDPQSETASRGLSLVRLNVRELWRSTVVPRRRPTAQEEDKTRRTRWRVLERHWGSQAAERGDVHTTHVHLGAFAGWQSALESRPVNATRGSQTQTCVFANLSVTPRRIL